MLKFKEWMIQEAMSLANAAQLFGYKSGDVIDGKDLQSRYRKLAMQYHPDRNPGDAEAEAQFKQAGEANVILGKLIGRNLPTFQTIRGQHYQGWAPKNPQAELRKDVQEELTRGIAALKKGQPEDAFAAVSRLVDPNTGKLNNPIFNQLLRTSLNAWLNYYRQGFHDYLEPILTNALKMV